MVLCKVLFIYHAILRYHIDEDERLLCAAPEPENEFEAAPIGSHQIFQFLTNFLVEKGVMQKSLSEGLYGIFKTASNKFNILLCCQDLSQLKFDNFLDIVEMSNRYGQQFKIFKIQIFVLIHNLFLKINIKIVFLIYETL